MLFSVIIPCFNSQIYVDKAICSLKEQKYVDFEAIFIDDFSTDNTYDYLLERLQRVQFKSVVVRNEKNSGPGVSKALGVSLATGDYITFMDSDDWYESTFFSSLFEIINSEKSDLIFFDAFRAHDNGKKVLIKNSTTLLNCKKNKDFIAVVKGCLPYICFKANLWQGVGLPAIYNAEDIAVIPILISKTQKISILPKPLYNYYYRANSLSNTPNATVYQSFLISYEYTCSNMPVGFEPELEFHGIKTVLYGAVLNALRTGITKSQFLEIIDRFERKHSDWILNQYIKYLPKSKQFFLKRVYAKQYWLLLMYVKLHRLALEYLKL